VEREESARRIEQMYREHQLMYAYKMLYQMGAIPKVTTTQLVGPDGRVPDTPEGMQRMWRTYFETLLTAEERWSQMCGRRCLHIHRLLQC
jgi:hypothetical protein